MPEPTYTNAQVALQEAIKAVKMIAYTPSVSDLTVEIAEKFFKALDKMEHSEPEDDDK